MTEKSGFLGLGATGGVAAGAATLAVLVGVLYGMGVLAPAEDPATEPTEAAAQAPAQPEPAPTTAEPSVQEPDPEPAAVTEEPVEDAPTTASTEDPVTADPEVQEETESAAAEIDADATTDPEANAMSDPAEETTTEPASTEEQVAEAAEETTEPQAETPLSAPRFDVVRAAPDGTTVIAGQAEPGSSVQILVDGEVADTQPANSQGEFASLLILPPSTQARVVTLLSTQGPREALSAEEIIIAPSPTPEVAASEPEPTPEPEQDAPEVAADADDAPQAEPDTATEAPTQTASAEPAITQAETSEPAQEMPQEATTTQEDEPAEPAAVAVLRADEEGVELVQPATPAPDVTPEQVTLDTIGYSPDGDVLLSGRAQADTLIRVYLDNAAVSDVTARTDGGWRARLDGIDPGVYTLRLDALSEDGAVLSRLETPFKRESPEALASAQPEVEAPAEPAPISQVTVQAGDTLWAISRERYGDGLLYVRVFEANRDAIRNPDLIYPGQIFTIPE